MVDKTGDYAAPDVTCYIRLVDGKVQRKLKRPMIIGVNVNVGLTGNTKEKDAPVSRGHGCEDENTTVLSDPKRVSGS